MKRVYAAAALMVAVGATIGYALAPQAPAAKEPVVAEQKPENAPTAIADKPRKHGGGGGSGFFGGASTPQNPLEKMAAAKGGGSRTDCYFLRISYRNAASGGAKSPAAVTAANQAKQAGCALSAG